MPGLGPGRGEDPAVPSCCPRHLAATSPGQAARCGSGESKVWTIPGFAARRRVRLVQCPLPRPLAESTGPRRRAVARGGRRPARPSTAWTRRGGKGGPSNSVLQRTAWLCTALHGTAGLCRPPPNHLTPLHPTDDPTPGPGDPTPGYSGPTPGRLVR